MRALGSTALVIGLVLGSGPPARASHTLSSTERDVVERLAVARGGSDRAALRARLDWEHWGLELYLCGVEDADGQARLRFCFELKAGVDRAWTSVGYARYRIASGRWHEAATDGLPRSRVVTLAADAPARQTFSVVVSRDVSSLRMSLGDRPLELKPERWASPQRAPISDRLLPAETSPPAGVETEAPLLAPGIPTRLEASLRWVGGKPFGDGALSAGEAGELLVEIENRGQRAAHGASLVVDPAQVPGVEFAAELPIPRIDPGEATTMRLPLTAGPDVSDGSVPLLIEVREPYGHDAPPLTFELNLRGDPPPQLVLTNDFAVEGPGLPIPRDTIVTVRLRVRNVGAGAARDVVAQVAPGRDAFPAFDTSERFDLGNLGPGEIAELAYRCYANQRASQLELQVELLHDGAGSSPARSLVTLPLEDSRSKARIVRVEPDPRQPVSLAPAPAPLTSDVDRFVPRSLTSRPDGLAVVLGVESYLAAPPATYAAEDARTAARYFEHALGIPASRIQLLLDEEVTLGQFQRIFGRDGWLARRIRENSDVFVFFAGHGVAGLEAFEPYLVPADGDLDYLQQTAYALEALIEQLAALDARSVTVFLDACFSGLTREGAALRERARPLLVVPAQRELLGVSLFSAGRGTQLAHSLDEQGHGLFSYFLFKGLAGAADLDTDRAISAGELKRYLETSIAEEAVRLDREQTPSIVLDVEHRTLVELP